MKQVIVIRDDIDMSRGKAVAQGAHVSVLAARKVPEKIVSQWIDAGGKKITLKVTSEADLKELYTSVDSLPKAKIEDLGYTELDPGTLTACAIGPADEDAIDEYTGHLALYR